MEEDAPTVEEFTEPYLATYTPPPAVAPGVCPVCRTGTGLRSDGTPWPQCWSCGRTIAGVSHPLRLLVPISLYRVNEQLHTVLKDYKRSPNARVREKHLWQVAAILHRFVFNHRRCIVSAAGRDWDTVTIVPSKVPRADAHPLEDAIALGEPLGSEYRRLLEPNEPDRIGRAKSSDLGYRTTAAAGGLHVLLVDDTFTSGATFQSAASTLALAGADVVAGVVIGRVIDTSNVEEHPEKLALWQQQRGVPFTFATCCLE
jgi:hypothetical protein